MRSDLVTNRASARADADEVALVRRIAAKERRAFDLLYCAYHRRLTRFLEQITHRPYLTEEVLNDTMLVVWRKAHTFDGTSRVSTWIFAIAYRKALKAGKQLGEPSNPPAEEGEGGNTPEIEAIQRES